jgi:hypothetical protein
VSWTNRLRHSPVLAGMSDTYSTMPGTRSSVKTRGFISVRALLTIREKRISR